jgi:hypothetical protein
MSGHVYVIAGDLRSIACDAWLLPTDQAFSVSDSFASAVRVDTQHRIPGLAWSGSRVLRLDPAGVGEPEIWLGDVGRWGEDSSWYAACVEPFVSEAADSVRSRAHPRLPVSTSLERAKAVSRQTREPFTKSCSQLCTKL